MGCVVTLLSPCVDGMILLQLDSSAGYFLSVTFQGPADVDSYYSNQLPLDIDVCNALWSAAASCEGPGYCAAQNNAVLLMGTTLQQCCRLPLLRRYRSSVMMHAARRLYATAAVA